MQIRIVSAAAVLAILFGVSLAHATTISVQPSSSTVTAGQTFTLSIDISGATDLYGYQFDLGFNPAVLSATGVSEGSFLPSGGSTIFLPGTIDNVGGTISSNADILDGAVAGVNGSGDLLDVTFQALAAGSSTVDIFNLIALNSFGQGETVSTVSGTVRVSAIPEPSTAMMLGIAVAGIATRMRSRTRRTD